MRPFITPNFKILEQSDDKKSVKVVVEPLEKGISGILAVPFRKMILSFLPGSAIFGLKIKGINSEFQNISGIYETTQQLIINIKGIVLTIDDQLFKDEEVVILSLNLESKKEVKAGDIICPDGVRITNPDHYLFQLVNDQDLTIDFLAKRSRGVLTKEQNKRSLNNEVNVIVFDSVAFSFIDQVGFEIEDIGIIDNFEYQKLIFSIVSKGEVEAIKVFSIIAKILISYFEFFVNTDIKIQTFSVLEEKEEEKIDYNQTLEELGFPKRAYNALEKVGINNLGQLIDCTGDYILKNVRNINIGTFKKIVERLTELGLFLKNKKD
jgi:DNA-directed RNA polymerase subunit alpha